MLSDDDGEEVEGNSYVSIDTTDATIHHPLNIKFIFSSFVFIFSLIKLISLK